MGGTHPCIFTALDGPTVYFARERAASLACYLHLLKESNSLLMMQIRKQFARGSRISVAKAESLGKFLLVFIKVNQVSVILGILAVNPDHRDMHRADDCDHAHHMPHTGL